MTEFPEFEDFFAAVHDHRPYRWQSRLAREVGATADGAKESNAGWPETIAAPTGAGKTAVIDIAIWRLAQAASADAAVGAPRTTPMRIVFAVDRRVIVDQAFERASMIACKLKSAAKDETGGPLAAVRDALLRFSGDNESPLHVEQLRGGMPREDDWAKTPSQPTVLCTTIDQLGSRLLFRGYGVSDRMAPIHAGLLGEDALIILDEAHLSAAFVETLSCAARWRKEREIDLELPWGCCLLTATPRDRVRAFHLRDEEREEDGIKKRLEARKEAVLDKINTEKQDGIAKAFADTARSLAGKCKDPAPVVAVIVNRVGLARAVYEKLRPATDKGGACDAILLTGRVRPVSRDDLISAYENDLSGKRDAGKGPLYVVATQCIEAGADFDFHAMLTQVAPLDALVQRFGRLARAGERSGAPAPAAILALKSDIAARTDDPVYGNRMKAAWDWLEERQEGRSKTKFIDFGVNALTAKIDADDKGAKDAMTAHPPAPFLREADVDFFSITSPRPNPEPALELFLHGELNRASDVQIVWRADLEPEDFLDGEDEQEPAIAIVDAMKPVSGEALAVPVWAARAWLRDDKNASDVADVAAREEHSSVDGSHERPVVRLRGGQPEVIRNIATRGALCPGDVIVVPTSYGGCDCFGWAPQSEAPVEDIADCAWRPYEKKRLRLRLHSALWAPAADRFNEGRPEEQRLPNWEAVKDVIANAASRNSASIARAVIEKDVDAALGAADLSSHPYLATLHDFTKRERSARPLWRGRDDETTGCVLVAGAETFSTGADDASSFTAPLSLCDHRKDVECKARKFSKQLRFPDPWPDVLGWAGCFHDDGKADERFQAYLRAFVDDAAAPADALAKSGAVRRGDRGAAGLPKHWRHEVLSVQMAIARLGDLPAGVDPALVLWLVGTHHGHGRPFFRHEDDWENEARTVWDVALAAAPGPHRLDFEWVHEGEGFDWAGLFVRLKRRYGYWGLAYLEAVLRLADHRASEEAELRSPEGAS